MKNQPLEGPIKPVNPIANLAAAIRTFAPLVNEKGEFNGQFGPRAPNVKCPELNDMISIAGEAMMEMHGFIGKYETLKHDAATLAIQFNALRQDYQQLGDIINNFTQLDAGNPQSILNAQTAARDYLLRLKDSRKREEPSDNGQNEPKPNLSVLPDVPAEPKEPDTAGEDQPS
jgi:hypothetical protein